MKILAVDSSAVSASAAVLEDGKIISSSFINISLTHSQTLLPAIKAMLENSKTDINDIDVFAVNSGPGSFTGIRIGVALIKGMSFGRDVLCAEVSTLDCISSAAVYPFGHYIIEAAMDARCSQIYNAAYEVTDGKVNKLCPDRAVKLEELKKELENFDIPIIFVGDGADLCYNYFSESKTNILKARAPDKYQQAVYTAFIAEQMARSGNTVTPEELSAKYLRMPQAEREYKNKQE